MHPVRAYYAFVSMSGLGFAASLTTYILFLQQEVGLSLSNIAFVNAMYWLMIVLLELPTGMIADGRGRRWSVRVGAFLYVLGPLVYYVSHSIVGVLLAELMLGLGTAFISGALDAWLADALTRRGEFERFRRVLGTGVLIRGAFMLGGGLFGAYFASTYGLRTVWLVDLIGFGLAFLVSMVGMGNQGEPLRRVTELEAFQRSWRLLRSNRDLGWAVAAAAGFGLVVTFNIYWAPYFEVHVGQVGLGWLWIPMYLGLMLAGYVVRRLRIEAGQEASALAFAVFVTGLGLFGLSSFLALPASLMALLLHEMGRGAFDPVLGSFTHRRVESEHRATFGSLQSLLARSGNAAVLGFTSVAAIWMPEGSRSIEWVWFVAGLLMIALAAGLYHRRPMS